MSLRRFGGFKNWEFAKTANFQTRNQEDSLYLIQNYKNLKSFIKRSPPRGFERGTSKDYLFTFNSLAKSLTKTDDKNFECQTSRKDHRNKTFTLEVENS